MALPAQPVLLKLFAENLRPISIVQSNENISIPIETISHDAAKTYRRQHFFRTCFYFGETTMRSDIPATIADLLPFPLFSRAADMTSSQDIVNTLESAGQFTTLVSALKVAGLSDTLKAAGPLTVFAPTDTAFQKLSAGILDTLLKPENHTKLAAILTYHMVAGNIKAAVVMTTSCAITLNRQAITLSLKGNQVKINDGTVIKADVAASNGTIHVIDTVLLPK